MRKAAITVLIVVAGVAVIFTYINKNKPTDALNHTSEVIDTTTRDISVVATNLDTPWELVFLPAGDTLVTERSGAVRYISPNGELAQDPIATIDSAREIGEGGLLGMALHPSFSENGFVYLYYTYSGRENGTMNRVVRMTYKSNGLTNEEIIIDAIPGAKNHNGGRIAFGPDGYLYVTTGDAENPSLAQNTDSLAGKILRVTDTGEPAVGNPFNNRIYSYGHRNPQGLAWDMRGRLWSTEHGRSGIQSGFDEINLIQPGGNYGWPEIQGDGEREGMIAPVKHSTATTTWAPAGAAVFEDSLYFTGLRGSSLYEMSIRESNFGNLNELFHNEFGRLRVAVLGPDNYLYIATSNRDGRGDPSEGDDKIIKISLH